MKKKKIPWGYLGFILPLVLGMICVVFVSLNSRQATQPLPMPQELVGEYSRDGEVWRPLTEEEPLSALDGDLFLRGHFLQPVQGQWMLYFYRNHIGVTILVNGSILYTDELSSMPEMDNRLFASMCGREWMSVPMQEVTAEDLVEIRLHNPHTAGNGDAYRDFLTTMCGTYPGSELPERNLTPYGQPFRIAGVLLAVAALLLMGAAMSAVILRDPVWERLLKAGLTTFFAGGAMVFDTIDLSFWSQLNVLNTYVLQLSIMLGVLCLGHLISDLLTGRKQRIARIAMQISGGLNSLLILLSLGGVTVIFDTLPLWALSQWVLCPVLMVCCIRQLPEAQRGKQTMLASGMLLLVGIMLDLTGAGAGILARGVWTKGLFMVLFVIYIVVVCRRVVVDYQGATRVKLLEQELEESRITIMLSQIKPHFLYNVLNAIYHLYRKEPETAQEAVSSFAEYLRCNMLSIEKNRPIPFNEEYRHIQTYLSLEQIRFRGKLDVVYDVEVSDFKLPPLTVEPLVENAVKHGVSKKRGGGIVTISTRRTEEGYCVTVADTGPGFDPEHYMEDGKPHVGIRNVKERLNRMVGGELTITSSDSGTAAVVTIPVKEEKYRDEDHRRG